MTIKKFFLILSIILFATASFLVFDLDQCPSKQITAEFLIFSIENYQKHVSPKLKVHVRCKFTPSCSNYAILAIKKYGAFKGIIKTIGRLCRCTPFSNQKGKDYP
ncbi:MAG: membrane protein insertion efficiency factor YidD [Methanosarcinales archaeon]